MSRFVALLDACVLVPVALTDTLLRLAEVELYTPLWSDRILSEATRAVIRVHPELDSERVRHRFRQMDAAFEDASVAGWEHLEPNLNLPDPDDRHVLAAAILGRADVIVTANLSDFPADVLRPYGPEAISADEFLLNQLDLAPTIVLRVLEAQASATQNPAVTTDMLLNALARGGAQQFAAQAREVFFRP